MRAIYFILFSVLSVLIVFSIEVAQVNTAYVVMFHPEMRDYQPEYTRFANNETSFEGTEQDRIKQRQERINEKLEQREKVEKDIEKIESKIKSLRKKLTDIVAEKNKKLFELNSRYRKEMKTLDINEVAEKEKERQKEYNKIIDQYDVRVENINAEILKLKDESSDKSNEIRAKSAADALNNNEGGIFLNASESRKKAQRIVDTINDSIKEIAQKNKIDMVLNRSHYDALRKIKDRLKFENVFVDDFNIDEGEISALPIPDDSEGLDQPSKPLHNLLDSDEEIDIVKFYSLRYLQIEDVVRPFYPPLIGNNVVYGEDFKVSKDITFEVIENIFDKYKLRDFEKQVSLKILKKILDK